MLLLNKINKVGNVKTISEISVFFPAFNEQDNIEKTVITAKNKLEKISKRFEILIIDDGSQDKTPAICRELRKKDKRIKIILHKKNQGYGAALVSGFCNSRYKWVVFTDADGQFNFNDIDKLIKCQKNNNSDMVIGRYMDRKVSFMRKINTFIWQKLVQITFDLKVKDIDCGFKMIRKEVLSAIMPLKSKRGAFISTEFLVKSKTKGFKISEIPVRHYPRKKGTPTGASIRVIINSFRDLLKLRRELKNV